MRAFVSTGRIEPSFQRPLCGPARQFRDIRSPFVAPPTPTFSHRGQTRSRETTHRAANHGNLSHARFRLRPPYRPPGRRVNDDVVVDRLITMPAGDLHVPV